jgi:hypothetical protein
MDKHECEAERSRFKRRMGTLWLKQSHYIYVHVGRYQVVSTHYRRMGVGHERDGAAWSNFVAGGATDHEEDPQWPTSCSWSPAAQVPRARLVVASSK